ncbi:hypothetical protein [Borreliella garinii]|uniref:Uncharacterized protein n=1 Tax=Borreliella garinii PBr TaxID=498743 RepID=B7XTA4_BORGR|nr:hypothetical protein [Borreliella garinii]EED28779.1 conserved hypothetical protein [Borreliella garinii PBr]EED30116.1 conserved hypothetical protein [Borreliella garinii Far04]WNZ66262.1 hypothetical protein PT139_00065 [Borreliella garinii]WNZ67258.1 hypothetical protein PT135_00065 [Borreliella garinii]WNZ68256.1 hypothetical protein PT138_00065 [Borreliella garinii]
MNNNILTKKLFLLKILTNNIEGKIIENFDKINNEIKQKIEKVKNVKIYQKNENSEETTEISIKNKNLTNLLSNSSLQEKSINDYIIIYVNKDYLDEPSRDIIIKWCKSIKMHNYKIIDTIESLNLEISNKNLKAILSCEEIDFFLNQPLRIQIVRGIELRFKGIPLVFTHLPINQIKNPELKKEIWQDLKIIKGIIKYG